METEKEEATEEIQDLEPVTLNSILPVRNDGLSGHGHCTCLDKCLISLVRAKFR